MWDLIISVPDHCLSFYFTMCFYLVISTTLQSNITTRRSKFDESRGRDNDKCESILKLVRRLKVLKMCFISTLRRNFKAIARRYAINLMSLEVEIVINVS